ncbi:sugar ABC transporter substrate-binding protein [Amycolatopsis minnesotensis]|uniref:Sugar ABC transporter substrate-binding protein n=1 Tax=Amycolatopsis minnesotensis TaxID=337894 RepID=A0ABP5C9A6_9PSEU
MSGARPWSRREVLRAAGAGALATSALAGCAPGRDPGEITFWNFYGPNGTPKSQADWFVKLADDWNASHQVKVRLRYIPPQEYQTGPTLQTAFSAGAGPDVFLISPGDFLRYYNGGALVDITPHLSEKARADFLPGVLGTRTVENRVYGLPMEIEPLALLYSEQAFERARLSEAEVPKTWDQLLDVARKLTTPDQFGLLLETSPSYYQNFTWYPFLWMGGGSVLSADQRSSALDAAAPRAAMKLWQDAVNAGVAPRRVRGKGANDSISNLAQGYTAMQQIGIWAVSEIAQQQPDFRYGVAPLPVPPGGKPVTALGGWAMVANAKGRNPQAAAEFVAWALGSLDDAGVERCRQWNTVAKTNLPARASVRDAAAAHGAFASGPMRTFVDVIAPTGTPEPRYPPELYRAVSDALQSCQLDGANPAEVTAAASDQINTFLSRYQGAAIQ